MTLRSTQAVVKTRSVKKLEAKRLWDCRVTADLTIEQT